MGYKIILITGIPASGKTTATKYISKRYSSFKVLKYGEVLFEHKKKEYPKLTYEGLREKSASIISSNDIKIADELIISKAKSLSSIQNVIIESHGVTRENFGFRITPYKKVSTIQSLNLDAIIYISSTPSEILNRMNLKADGRKNSTLEQINQNLRLQENLALNYAVLTGSPFYSIENNESIKGFQDKVHTIINQILKI